VTTHLPAPEDPVRTLSLAALALLLGACAPAATTLRAGAMPSEAVMLQVRNENWADATVYLVREGVGIRLGTVAGLSTRSFRLSSAHIGAGHSMALRMETRLPHAAFTSSLFNVRPGQRIEYRFEASPRPSSPSVF
jgi:hypothetical protein